MKVKVTKELLGPIYVMGIEGALVPKYRIADGTQIWDKFYSTLKRPYSNFKRNSEKKLVLWGCMYDPKRGFCQILSNDYAISYLAGVEVYNEIYFDPFKTVMIPKCVALSVVLTNKEFKLEYSKIIKDVKKYIEKNDYNLVGPIQEKFENDNVTLYFPIEVVQV